MVFILCQYSCVCVFLPVNTREYVWRMFQIETQNLNIYHNTRRYYLERVGHITTKARSQHDIYNTCFPFNLIQIYYSCGLSTATIEYSCQSVCLSVCLFACVHNNSKNNGPIHLKLEHIVVYEIVQKSSTLSIVRSRSRSRRDFEIFIHLPQY